MDIKSIYEKFRSGVAINESVNHVKPAPAPKRTSIEEAIHLMNSGNQSSGRITESANGNVEKQSYKNFDINETDNGEFYVSYFDKQEGKEIYLQMAGGLTDITFNLAKASMFSTVEGAEDCVDTMLANNSSEDIEESSKQIYDGNDAQFEGEEVYKGMLIHEFDGGYVVITDKNKPNYSPMLGMNDDGKFVKVSDSEEFKFDSVEKAKQAIDKCCLNESENVEESVRTRAAKKVMESRNAASEGKDIVEETEITEVAGDNKFKQNKRVRPKDLKESAKKVPSKRPRLLESEDTEEETDFSIEEASLINNDLVLTVENGNGETITLTLKDVDFENGDAVYQLPVEDTNEDDFEEDEEIEESSKK